MELKWTNIGSVFHKIKLFSWFLWPACVTYSVVPSRPRGVGEAVTVSNGVFLFFPSLWHWILSRSVILSCSSLPLAASSSLSGWRAANRRHSVTRTAALPALFSSTWGNRFQRKSEQRRKKQTNQTKEIKRVLNTGFSAAESRRSQTLAGEGTQCSEAPAAVWKKQTSSSVADMWWTVNPGCVTVKNIDQVSALDTWWIRHPVVKLVIFSLICAIRQEMQENRLQNCLLIQEMQDLGMKQAATTRAPPFFFLFFFFFLFLPLLLSHQEILFKSVAQWKTYTNSILFNC